jgi:Concanavalin A-like lectin/glucanases superfamily/PKD domain
MFKLIQMKKNLVVLVIILQFICCNKQKEPTADFEAEVCTAPCEVTFINKSLDADAYKWDFGDGTTSNEENPKHLYVVNKTYTVILEANSSGGSSKNSKRILISLAEKPAIINTSNDNGLLAYYAFEKDFKNAISDSYTGIGNNISFDTITPSKKGYAALFEPSKFSRMSIAINPFFELNQGSICFWMQSFKTAPQAIIHANSLSNRSGFNLILDQNFLYNEYVEYQLSWGKWEIKRKFENFNTANILDGGWHFVAITIKPNEHRLYIDGVLIQNSAIEEGLQPTNINNGMVIGQFVNDTYLYLYQGRLDNLRLYGRAISEKELKDIFNKIQ